MPFRWRGSRHLVPRDLYWTLGHLAMCRRKRYFLMPIVVCIVVAAVLCITKPATPAGRYVASSSMACGGDYYYELRDGQAFFVVQEPATNGGTSTFRDKYGSYYETNEAWVLFNDREVRHSNAVPYHLTCSWFGVSISATNGYHAFDRRRFLPYRRPEWMLDWLPWCLQ